MMRFISKDSAAKVPSAVSFSTISSPVGLACVGLFAFALIATPYASFADGLRGVGVNSTNTTNLGSQSSPGASNRETQEQISQKALSQKDSVLAELQQISEQPSPKKQKEKDSGEANDKPSQPDDVRSPTEITSEDKRVVVESLTPTDQNKFVEEISHSGKTYIFRGVGVDEAFDTVVSGSVGRGRINREHHAIQDDTVVPGFAANSINSDPLTPTDTQHMWQDARFYATDATYNKEPGYILVFQHTPSPLERHPESNVKVFGQVVAIPGDAKLVAVLPLPLRFDRSTGLPIYPKDPKGMEAALKEAESSMLLKYHPLHDAYEIVNGDEVEDLKQEIISKYHGLDPMDRDHYDPKALESLVK